MSHTDRGLGRRLQLQQGLIWLAAAQGDTYAALLRGLDIDPRDHWRALRAQPLSRSATGDWVAARHPVAQAALTAPELRGLPLFDAHDDASWPDAVAAAARRAATSWEHTLDRTASDGADLVAVARDAAVGALARACGLDEAAERALHTAVLRTRGALDAPFYPQSRTRTREIADGLAALRALVPAGFDIAVAGIPMATDLVADAVTHGAATGDGAPELWDRLTAEPGHADRVVRETLRLAPPLRLHVAVADAPCELGGQHIEAGERVVTVLGAAHRDPEVFPDPDRFDADRPREQQDAVLVPDTARSSVLPFAVACAREGLRALAARRPRPVGTEPLVRRAAAPVSPSLVARPMATV
ncbi:cytochrome P450 [Streptomyces sp. NPDC055243]|uniref:cytochrome P450 n=1 Tax=Streptomyces sp. NPDC055243 TaxID=3365720 RepID=UPI0037D4BB86